MPAGSYPPNTNKAVKIMKLQVSMWKSNCKNFFIFSRLPMARNLKITPCPTNFRLLLQLRCFIIYSVLYNARIQKKKGV